MFGKDFVTQCRMVCWAASAGGGLLAVILLSFQANLFAAILVGIALAVLSALVLVQLFCWDDEDADDGAKTVSTPVGAAAAAGKSAASMAAAGAGAASAALSGDNAAKKPASADAKEEKSASPVKSGTLLKGEQEIAESKGDWKYEPEGTGGTGSAAKPPEGMETKADSSNLFVSEDADAEAGAQVTPEYAPLDPEDGETEGTKPAGLTGPREGKADNLKEIKGVGPKLETMLNDMGFYHFDQIANWTPQETAWVDANLKGFKGRASRDEWISQAKILADGGDTEFSKRVDKGGVY